MTEVDKMTLDEYIEHFNLVVVYAKRGGEYPTNFSDLDNFIAFNTGVLGYLKELKTLRVEHEKNSKELEDYKKALKMACHQITYLDCDSDCDLFENCKHPCTTLACGEEDTWVDFYLKKARSQG